MGWMARVLVLVVALLAGCATSREAGGRYKMEQYPLHYRQFDVELAYRVSDLGSQTLVDGMLRSLRYQYMEDAEVWVAALGSGGKTEARTVSYLPHELRQGEIASFSAKLPVQVAPGSTLRFTYKYQGSDGGDDKGEERMQSFDAVVPPR
ncbi:hypothetical protein GMST_34230 [Geomonas silvestris]|uniref:Lipoprotein n=1 Tax=Geomonas silvestris TaxID=2740184 RepID=A0A6V8MM65_9BACT|nr:hypothetical protein [Geomonas silvestris]GFO61098.1 hypothetical protein GMST_34230 [Geomonas silvestris]